MRFSHTLTNVLGKSRTQRLLKLAAFELCAQFVYRRDSELFIGAKNALRVEPGIAAEPSNFRRRLRSQCFELSEGSSTDDFLHGMANCLPDPGVCGEVCILMNEILNAF